MTTQRNKRLIQAVSTIILLLAVWMTAREYARQSANRAAVAWLAESMSFDNIGKRSATPIPEDTRRLIYRQVIAATASESATDTPSVLVLPTGYVPTSDLALGQGTSPRVEVRKIAKAHGIGQADVLAIAQEGAAGGW